ncbi:MAG: Crp/Fnr family transcriptional regulator [Paenibacillaceae bacterium ZCTH02-B3]|nr:MAG: Crp/Fnr family transcriptional regulator [Paenibacillaceae bacterium ZCTH02-B3]
MVQWLRESRIASVILAVLRIYLGWLWLDAGWHKVVDGFDASGYLRNAVANPVVDKATGEALYPNFVAFLEHVALPNVGMINFLVAWGELLIGLGLILGVLTSAAAFFGLMLNFLFMFAGTVSSNPWMALIGVIVLAAGANAGKWGGDYFLLPWLRNMFGRLFGKGTPVRVVRAE